MTRRSIAVIAAKLGFAAAAVAMILHKVNAPRVWMNLREARLAPVFAGALLMLFAIAIAGWRWRQLLRIFEIEVPLKPLICVAQVGQFFMMFLPGPLGDDLTRMLYISRLAPGRVGEACTSVLLDRCLGLTSVLVLALCCIPFHWRVLAVTQQTHLLAIGVLTGAIFVCATGPLFFLSAHRGGFVSRGARYLPAGKARDEYLRIHTLLATHKATVARVVGAALVTQLLLCAAYGLAGLAVGIHAPVFAWFGFVPIVIAANAFPVTVAGIGVRDYLMVLFLRVLAGVPGESALAASFLVLAMTLAVCLLGGIVYIFYRPHRIASSTS